MLGRLQMCHVSSQQNVVPVQTLGRVLLEKNLRQRLRGKSPLLWQTEEVGRGQSINQIVGPVHSTREKDKKSVRQNYPGGRQESRKAPFQIYNQASHLKLNHKINSLVRQWWNYAIARLPIHSNSHFNRSAHRWWRERERESPWITSSIFTCHQSTGWRSPL